MEKPNILLITTDQQRFDTINALGNHSIYTPHLNWLVDDGITFTNCYTTSPICMAARATIMTGKHGYNTGLVGNKGNIKPMKDNKTLPQILTENGYQTRAQGKMHFSPTRANYGFEHMELPMDYYREHNKNEGLLGHPKCHGVGENEITPVISTVSEQNSVTSWTVRRSIDFLETRDDTRPFFMWTSFAKPHPPFDPCENYWNLYAHKNMPAPICGDWSKNHEDVPKGFMKPTYTLNHAYRMNDEEYIESKKAYYACITQIDYSLGMLFARMREMDLLENTWIIFTADHGDMLGDHHLGAKCNFFEGSAHIPLIIRPPHTAWDVFDKAGEVNENSTTLADIMPTILSIAGIEYKDHDGANVLDLSENRPVYGNCEDEFFMILENKIKYVFTNMGKAELLFDLNKDPYEQVNLINSSEYSEILKHLKEKLKENIKKSSPHLICDNEIVIKKGPTSPRDTVNWPGFHSTTVESDVLH